MFGFVFLVTVKNERILIYFGLNNNIGGAFGKHF